MKIENCKCGKEPAVREREEDEIVLYYVECECGKKSPSKFTEEKAIRQWNKMVK